MYNGKVPLTLIVAVICSIAVALLAACSGGNEFKDPSTLCETNTSEKEETMTTEITDERIREVRDKYRELFRRQPNYRGNSITYLRDENGEWTEVRGIIVRVNEKVDQSALPVEDRIPDCLEGVPIQIIRSSPALLLSDSLENIDKEETSEQN
ncbi:MAG: hypothetical protein OXH22_01870 [Chloroflexi bacterium]|nr:hypothetical protein [Chloroflexota bacterium]